MDNLSLFGNVYEIALKPRLTRSTEPNYCELAPAGENISVITHFFIMKYVEMTYVILLITFILLYHA